MSKPSRGRKIAVIGPEDIPGCDRRAFDFGIHWLDAYIKMTGVPRADITLLASPGPWVPYLAVHAFNNCMAGGLKIYSTVPFKDGFYVADGDTPTDETRMRTLDLVFGHDRFKDKLGIDSIEGLAKAHKTSGSGVEFDGVFEYSIFTTETKAYTAMVYEADEVFAMSCGEMRQQLVVDRPFHAWCMADGIPRFHVDCLCFDRKPEAPARPEPRGDDEKQPLPHATFRTELLGRRSGDRLVR